MPIRRAPRRRDGAHPLTPPLNPAAARERSFSGRWSVVPAQRLRGRRPWSVRCWLYGGRGSPDGPGAGHAAEAPGDIPDRWGGVVPQLSVPHWRAAGLGLRQPACWSAARTTSGACQMRLGLRSLIPQMEKRGMSLGRIRRDRMPCAKVLRVMGLKTHGLPDSSGLENGVRPERPKRRCGHQPLAAMKNPAGTSSRRVRFQRSDNPIRTRSRGTFRTRWPRLRPAPASCTRSTRSRPCRETGPRRPRRPCGRLPSQ